MNKPAPWISWLKPKITPRLLIFCFLLGAVCGTIGDFIHVVTHVDGYPADGPFPFLPFIPARMPIWVPFLFGGAVVLMGSIHRLFCTQFTPRLTYNLKFVIASPIIFLLIYAGSGIIKLPVGSWQDLWLAAAAITFWWLADRTLIGGVLAIGTGIGGTLFEIFLVHVHGFYYYPDKANMFGVASWLPWLYVAASVCVSLWVRWI